MVKRSRKNIFSWLTLDWFYKLGRNTKLGLVLGAILVVVGVAAFLASRSSAPEDVIDAEPAQVTEIDTADLMNVSITSIEGTLEYRTLEQGWEAASEETTIMPGMSLRTVGAVSRAILQLDDGSEVRMDANSQIKIANMSTNRVIIEHEDGYVYSRIVSSDTRDYIVETENAQFQSVGTAFRTIATGDEEAVEVYQSKVDEVVTNKSAQSGEKIIIEAEDQLVNSKVEIIDIEKLKDNEFIQWNKDLDEKNELFRNSLGFLSDFEGPKITIKDPKASSTVTIAADADPKVTITGTTEADARVTVLSKSVKNSEKKDVDVGDDGKFKTPELDANFGNSVFEFTAVDRRGNETKLNVRFTFSRETAVQEQGIVLTLSETESEVNLAWGLVGLTAPEGIQVVYGQTSSPALDGDKTTSLNPTAGSMTQKISKGELSKSSTYYFRVCRTANGGCDVYSNEVSVTIPTGNTP